MHQNAFGDRAEAAPAGSLQRSPGPLTGLGGSPWERRKRDKEGMGSKWKEETKERNGKLNSSIAKSAYATGSTQ